MEYDLSNIPWEVLKTEYEHRKAVRKEERRKAKLEAKSCKNCAHRFMSNPTVGGQFTHETWVCEVKPKVNIRSYTGRQPRYSQSYRTCGHYAAYNCGQFVDRRSEEGKKIVAKRDSMMSNRMSDNDY